MKRLYYKPLYEYDEAELRELIKIRRRQFQQAQKRVDEFGSIRCIEQALNYQNKYCKLLWIMKNRSFKLTEEEVQIAGFGL